MKRFIKSLCLIGSIFSLSACESYGKQISLQHANQLLESFAEKEDPNVYTESTSITIKSSSDVAVNKTSFSTTKALYSVSINLDKLFFHSKVSSKTDTRIVNEYDNASTYFERWFFYKEGYLFKAEYLDSRTAKPSKTYTKSTMSIESAKKYLKETTSSIISNVSVSISIEPTSVINYSTLLKTIDETIYTENNISEDDVIVQKEAKFFSKNDTNLSAVFKRHAKYEKPKTNLNPNRPQSFTFDLSLSQTVNDCCFGNSSTSYKTVLVDNYGFKSTTTYSSKSSSTKSCKVVIPNLSDFSQD